MRGLYLEVAHFPFINHQRIEVYLCPFISRQLIEEQDVGVMLFLPHPDEFAGVVATTLGLN